MSLPPGFLDELRHRVGLVSLIGRRVKLMRAGREWKGCCPFHQEKTPSFYVNEDKGFYHCFGCGAHGDALGFVMAAEGEDFMGAVRRLAAEAGVDVPAPRPPTPAERRQADARDWLERAMAWYRRQLEGPAGAEARAYAERRGLDAPLRERFGLGFAPAGGLLAGLRLEHGPPPPELLAEAGLVAEGGRERFRERLVFPIHDARGRAAGLGGRLMAPGEPKYLNSAEGPLFSKRALLYNLHRAAPAARRTGRLFVVEGYMDVLALARAGLDESVAPLGTALTPEQLRLAWRLVDVPILAFDGDEAGRRAARRAAEEALALIKAPKSLAVALLEPGMDPDDLARRDGRDGVERLAAAALPLDRFLFEAEALAEPLDTPERWAGLAARMDMLAGRIDDRELGFHYRRAWRAALREWQAPAPGRGAGRSDAPGRGRAASVRADVLPATRAARSPRDVMASRLLASFEARPEAVELYREALAELPLDRALGARRDALLEGSAGGGPADRPLVDMQADEEGARGVLDAALASLVERHHIHDARRSARHQGMRSDDELAAAAGELADLRALEEDGRRALDRLARSGGAGDTAGRTETRVFGNGEEASGRGSAGADGGGWPAGHRSQ